LRCLAYNGIVPGSLAAHIARALTEGERAVLEAVAEAICGLTERLGLPRSLLSVSVDVTELDQMAAASIRDNSRPANPGEMSDEPGGRLLSCIHSGDLRRACDTITGGTEA